MGPKLGSDIGQKVLFVGLADPSQHSNRFLRKHRTSVPIGLLGSIIAYGKLLPMERQRLL
jgi:hypothetical protein